MCKFLADVYRLNLTDKNLCFFGNCYACKSSDCNGLLTNDFSVESAVDDDSLSYLFCFFIIKEVAATCLEFLFNLVVNLLFNDN